MATVRDIMSEGAERVRSTDTLQVAARKMRDAGVGSLPVCAGHDRLVGMITDRDIVVRCVADHTDPSETPVSELTDENPLTVRADDSVDSALRTMLERGVRRLPVVDGHRLVGMVTQADLALDAPPLKVGDLMASLPEEYEGT